MKLCLYTGVDLRAEQRIEHAPPESVGGRFKSVWGVSSEFNNSCSVMDRHLADCWWLVTTELRGLLPSSVAGSGRIVMQGGKKYRLGPDGGIRLLRSEIERDSNGRITRVRAPDTERLRQIVGASPHLKELEEIVSVPGVDCDVFELPGEYTSVEAEVASLRALLTAFDVAYEHDPTSWVRSHSTGAARRVVASLALQGAVDDAETFLIVLGYRYDLRDHILDLVRRAGVVVDEFEHIFVASGNPATKSIDACWLVFGYEPLCFRVGRNYEGPWFTDLIGCSPLRNGERWGPMSISTQLAISRGYSALGVKGDGGRDALRSLLFRHRTYLTSRARVVARERVGEPNIVECANYFLALQQRNGTPPKDSSELAIALLSSEWSRRSSATVVREIIGENPEWVRAIDCESWAPGNEPQWAASAALIVMYASAILSERFGVPRAHWRSDE